MPERTPIICKGRVPGTDQKCGNELLETDGKRFYLQSLSGTFWLEINPPRIVCDKCGFQTVLSVKKNKTLQLESI